VETAEDLRQGTAHNACKGGSKEAEMKRNHNNVMHSELNRRGLLPKIQTQGEHAALSAHFKEINQLIAPGDQKMIPLIVYLNTPHVIHTGVTH
jgi:hypothetical protein